MNGFLLVDKPEGPTSHDVVGKVRWLLKQATGQRFKVGHAGTLDPLASGLLILGVGKATKELGKLVGLDKVYECTVTLGATTATDDREGEPQPWPQAVAPSRQTVEAVLALFLGDQQQVPPQYSAKKIAGKKMYELARQGKTVVARPHTITVHQLDLLSYIYPNLTLRVHCSSGTYIRSLARDIGERLKVGGYVQTLRRTHIGTYAVADATPFADIETYLGKHLVSIV